MSRPLTRRGIVLIVCLAVISIGAMVGTGLLYAESAHRTAAAAATRRLQSRALAWSGVQAAVAQLASQRDALLAGEAPDLTDEWTVFENADGSRGVFRIVATSDGRLATSEMGKIDVNAAPAEILALVPGLSESAASKIVTLRGGTPATSPLTSIAELLAIDGITSELLYGSAMDAESFPGFAGVETVPPLASLLTTYSFEPNVQAGLGEGSRHTGNQRVNLNVKWSDRLGRAVTDRFGPDVARGVEGIMGQGATFKKDSDIVATLRRFNVEPLDWMEVLDAFTTENDEYRLGRVDLLTAGAEVLACIPGLDADRAAEIVSRRDKLSPEARQSVVWPVIEGIVPPEDFEKCVDHVASRSLQWRIVVEGGLLSAEAARMAPAFRDDGAGGDRDLPSMFEEDVSDELEGVVVLEAVIDVSSQRPRIAYLRDATMERVAQRVSSARASAREHAEGIFAGHEDLFTPSDDRLFDDASASGAPGTGVVGDPPSSATSHADPGEVRDRFDAEPGSEANASRRRPPRPPPRAVSSDAGDRRGSAGTPAPPSPQPPDDETDGADTSEEEGAVDRRIGRWTPGHGGTR